MTIMKIEATGNTLEDAEGLLSNKRDAIKAQGSFHFCAVNYYGNFEIGYKLVQEYWPEEFSKLGHEYGLNTGVCGR